MILMNVMMHVWIHMLRFIERVCANFSRAGKNGAQKVLKKLGKRKISSTGNLSLIKHRTKVKMRTGKKD